MTHNEITKVNITPDLTGNLVTIFYKDGGKLAVTVVGEIKNDDDLIEGIVGEIERRMSLFNGCTKGSYLAEFSHKLVAAFHNRLTVAA